MPWLQLITTILFLTWMFATVLLLWMIWRQGVRRTHLLEQTLIDTATKNAQANKEMVHKLLETGPKP